MQSFFIQEIPLILASASPRRRELLQNAAIRFTAVPALKAEPAYEKGEAPENYVMKTAEAKVREVASSLHLSSRYAVLGADTVVVLQEAGEYTILGKPGTSEKAFRMLQTLSGRVHEVYTGCCILLNIPEYPQKQIRFFEQTSVSFGLWPEEILRQYSECGESFDKAGGYAIQGRGGFLVDGIHGLWSTVVGLPVPTVIRYLLDIGVLSVPSAGVRHAKTELENVS